MVDDGGGDGDRVGVGGGDGDVGDLTAGGGDGGDELLTVCATDSYFLSWLK